LSDHGKEPAALFSRISLPSFCFDQRSLPPSRRTDTCLSCASYGACRPCKNKCESLTPRTDKHLPPLAHPRAVGSPPPRLSSTITHNQHAAIEAPRQSARVLKAAREAHATRRNASPAVAPGPIPIRTQAAFSKRFVTKSIHVLCIRRSNACGLHMSVMHIACTRCIDMSPRCFSVSLAAVSATKCLYLAAWPMQRTPKL
jgi:hypothetical protein